MIGDRPFAPGARVRHSAPCANGGGDFGGPMPISSDAADRPPGPSAGLRRIRITPSCAVFPKATTKRSAGSSRISSRRKGRQLAISSVVGRFSGGTHRQTAERKRSRSAKPSSLETDFAREENPARWSAGKRKSPEESPVNMRPVRFDPCAPGARPATRTRASGSPNPGTGLPQYSSERKARRFSHATRSRHSTRRGHRRQRTIRTSRSRSISAADPDWSIGVGFMDIPFPHKEYTMVAEAFQSVRFPSRGCRSGRKKRGRVSSCAAGWLWIPYHGRGPVSHSKPSEGRTG
jgi:hypothetical protein